MSTSTAVDTSTTKPTARRTSARTRSRVNALQTQIKKTSSSDSSPSSPPSNTWKQVKIEHAKDVEETLLAQCESYYQLMLQRLSGSNSKEAEQTVSDTIASTPMLSSSTSLDLVHKCSRVGSRYQADIPTKLSIIHHQADLTRFPEYAEPLIYPHYWTQTSDQSIHLSNQHPSAVRSISESQTLSSSSSSSSHSSHPYLRGGPVTLGKQTLTREQEYQVRYLSSTPAFPAFEFVRSKLCSPLSLKYRTEVIHKRAQVAEDRLGSSVRIGGRGRRSTRINPELAPPVPKPNVIDTAKQMPLVWERMLNTGGQLTSGDGRRKLACMVHEIVDGRQSVDMSAELEALDHTPAPRISTVVTKSKSKKQKVS